MKTPLLPGKKMRRLDFWSDTLDNWYFVQRVGKNITFNLTINKNTGEYETLVLNESFLQPEYYADMREPYRTATTANIDVIVHELNRAGLTITHDHTEYGYKG